MTPTQVRELSAPEYVAFNEYMDKEYRELKRQAKAKAKSRKR